MAIKEISNMSKFPSLFVIAKPDGTFLCSKDEENLVFADPVKEDLRIDLFEYYNLAQDWLNRMKSMSRYDWNPGTGCYIDFENVEALRPEEFANAFVLEYARRSKY